MSDGNDKGKIGLPLVGVSSEARSLKDIPANLLDCMNRINRELNHMGRPRTIVVYGDEGVGKTFVIEQFAHHVNEFPSIVKNRVVKFMTDDSIGRMFTDGGGLSAFGMKTINAINRANRDDPRVIIVANDFHVAAVLSVQCKGTSFIVELGDDALSHAMTDHESELNKMSAVCVKEDMGFTDMMRELKRANDGFSKAYGMDAMSDASIRSFVRSLNSIASGNAGNDDNMKKASDDEIILPIGYVIDSLEYAYVRSLEKPYAGKRITPKMAKEMAFEAFESDPFVIIDGAWHDSDDGSYDDIMASLDEVFQRNPNGKGRVKVDKLMKYNDPLHLADRLKKTVINQDAAVDMVSKAILIDAAKLKPANKPVASFLFLGPSGVGKTQLAKSLAATLFEKPANFVRIDCSELSEKHTASRLFGTTPGYVGFEQGGELTNAVREHPQSVVLLDEVEKAHADIWNTFLQVFDDARLTDGSGKTTDFSHCVFILTGNLGTREAEQRKTSGFGNPNETDDKNAYEKAMRDFFRPEFINRLDGICFFNRLSRKDYVRIMQIKLDDIGGIIKSNYGKDVDFKLTQPAMDDILKKAKSLDHGAREIEQVLKRNVVLPMAEKILSSDISFDGDAAITIDDDKHGDLTLRMSRNENENDNAEKE